MWICLVANCLPVVAWPRSPDVAAVHRHARHDPVALADLVLDSRGRLSTRGSRPTCRAGSSATASALIGMLGAQVFVSATPVRPDRGRSRTAHSQVMSAGG